MNSWPCHQDSLHQKMHQDATNARSVEQFEEALRNLELEDQRLRNYLQCLIVMASRMLYDLRQLSPRQSLPQTTVPRLEWPEKFDGDASKFRGFANQVRLCILMQPLRYPTVASRVDLVGTLLSGTASEWFASLFWNKSPLFDDFEGFMAAFAASFGKVAQMKADTKNLCQGSRSASAYASLYRHLSFVGEEHLWTSSRQRKRKHKSSERGSLPKQLTRFITSYRLARKAKQKSKCRSRNRDRQEKHFQQQEYWLTPEEPETISTEDSEDDMGMFSLRNWVEIARFRYGENFSRGGGFFLMVNLVPKIAVLQRYESWDGYTCETGSYRYGQNSDAGRDKKMQSVLDIGLSDDRIIRASYVVPCQEMYRRAQLCVDPYMHLRTIQEGEAEFEAVSTLYAMYTLFHKQVISSNAPDSWLTKRRWSCRMWDARRLRGIVRLQALYRGWSCRNRVGLFSPHTELGRRFLMLQWKRLVLHESSIVLHAD